LTFAAMRPATWRSAAAFGQMMARLEAELLFAAFARWVASFELAGEPVRRPNNALGGFCNLAGPGSASDSSCGRRQPLRAHGSSRQADMPSKLSVMSEAIDNAVPDVLSECGGAQGVRRV
jgi:hypothetical protein